MQAADRSGRQATWCSVVCECGCVQVFRQSMDEDLNMQINMQKRGRYVYSQKARSYHN